MAATNQTMQEGLNRLVADIAQMMVLPDADLDFLSQLQMAVTQYVKQPTQSQQPQSAVPGGAGGPTPGGPPGPGIANSSGMMGGASMGVGTPNPDELRRMLSTQSGGQGG